jgi:uncharacterized protein
MGGLPDARAQQGDATSPTDEERLWSRLSHLSLFVLIIVGPRIIMSTAGKRSSYVRHHAVEALNFQITVTVAATAISLLSSVLIHASPLGAVIEYVPLLAVFVAATVLPIRAAGRARRGELYRYPLTLRLVKQGPAPVEPGNAASPSTGEGSHLPSSPAME